MKKILVAEDDQFLLKIYNLKLKQKGFDVVTAVDGQDALDKIKADKPDMLLLDLIMPKVDGFEVLETIKKDPKLSGIKIIVLSNLGQEADVERAKKLGAEDYIVKANTELEDIFSKMEKFLSE